MAATPTRSKVDAGRAADGGSDGDHYDVGAANAGYAGEGRAVENGSALLLLLFREL